MEYSLKDLFAILMKRLVFIILCTVLGLTSFFIINRYIKKPIYTASVQMYVNPNESSTVYDLSQLNYAQKVIATYVQFLKTKAFYQQVAEETKLPYSPDEIQAMTSIQIVNSTEIFQISVTSYSARDSFKIVEAMQVIAPELIKSIKSNAEISIVDPVELPRWPSGPNVSFNTVVGGVLGFLFSVSVTFLWEFIDTNVKNKEELLMKYCMPVLGSIPNYHKFNRIRFRIIKAIPQLRKFYLRRVRTKDINKDKRFEVSEAYNELRTNLRFTVTKNECKKVIISSPIPEDGKSTTSVNLAITIAQTGVKVLLIDCDLRKGRIHNFFNIKSKPGLSDVLSGLVADKDVIQNTSYENLHVLPMGSLPPNPSDLLGSARMEEIITKLEKQYDYIIIDTPPINVVSDVLSLVKLVDGIVIVVREGITSHPNIVNALNKYKLANAKILGFVINGTSSDQGKTKTQYYYYRD